MATRPFCALVLVGLLAAGSGPSFAVPPSSGAASAGPISAAASLEYLRQVMDQYHQSFGVYEDVSSAGNHFHSWAKIPNQNAAVTMDGSSTTSPHAGATAIRAEFQTGANFGGFYLLNGVLTGSQTTPQPNFGGVPNAGFDVSGATALTFWAAARPAARRSTSSWAASAGTPGRASPSPPLPTRTRRPW